MLTISDKVTWKRVKKGTIIVDLKSGDYFTLNETSSLIWGLLLQGKDVGEIHAHLTEEFEGSSPEKVLQDVESQREYFIAEGLLIEKQGT